MPRLKYAGIRARPKAWFVCDDCHRKVFVSKGDGWRKARPRCMSCGCGRLLTVAEAKAMAAHGEIIPFSLVWRNTLYALLYVALVLLASSAVFSRRNLK